MALSRELNLQRRVIAYLRRNYSKAVVFKLNDRFRSGLPDLLILTRSRTIFMEFKAEDGTVKPIQASTIRKINATGGQASAHVVRSLKQAKRIMKGGENTEQGTESGEETS